MIAALLASLALGASSPSEQTVVYYNARMALREERPVEAVKLWLLHNAIEEQTGTVSAQDADFGSVTWAALGAIGVCQDGQPTDEDGAGLWPLALHNQIVRTMGRRHHARRVRPFDAFELGRQQRVVAIGDVLGAAELRTLRLSRGRCQRPRRALIQAGEPITAKLSDRQTVTRLLRYLLERSRSTLRGDRVRGRATIEARLFDIDLQLTALAARQARLDARRRARRGRVLGLSPGSILSMTALAPTTTLTPASQAAQILRGCVDWPVSEWMALSPDRRLFLFHHARVQGGDPAALDRIALGVIDRLADQGEGARIGDWIAQLGDAPEVVWGGDRGRRLLALDAESGFRERGVIALHRGVAELERGELSQAMRSLAFALQLAPESRADQQVQRLSRRWMSYVAGQFEITDELLMTLRELVPRRDFSIILEDLMWRAALRADRPSLERGERALPGRGALTRRLALMRPLAAGDVGRFSADVRDGLARSPIETLRFLQQMVERLEREDADVRRAQLPTLARVRTLVQPLASEGSGRAGRLATLLVERCQAIQEGLVGLGPDASAEERSRALAPGSEVFAGSVRLAPVDPLPWPFHVSEPSAPSVFSPLVLTPEEWRDQAGALVFGWSIGG